MTGTTEWRSRYAAHMMNTFAVPARLLVRGSGTRVWDDRGVEYLDFLAGIAVNVLGHAHPALVAAVSEQVGKLVHVSNYFATKPQIEFAERLLRLAGAGEGPGEVPGRVFFANSGTEANEAALKIARLHRPRGRVLALHQSFHGRTMGSMALTGKPKLRAPFEPMPAGIEHIDSTVEALEEAMGDDVAAVFLEPIKGEAGILDLPEGYLAEARRITREHDALLILDEIQTGVGRTGRWFAFQHDGIMPDVVTLAKGIAGGVPTAATIAFGPAAELLTPGQHGTTFGGNPLATAAGNAVLGEIERAGLVENAARRGAELRALLTGPLAAGEGGDLIVGTRGRGLMIGVALSRPVGHRLYDACLDAGLIVNAPNETTIRLVPPLILDDRDIADFAERFAAGLAAVKQAAPATAGAR
ncbi:MAG TPA: acetylornithine transaminase [Microbacteriaceae bacterium]|nr:acetylornithine transaminase [Microbacteriaceae bacterium]